MEMRQQASVHQTLNMMKTKICPLKELNPDSTVIQLVA
jgi:hypothetical protein